MSRCSKCNVEKDDSEFSWKNRKLGIKHKQCKSCVNSSKKSSYYQRNSELHKLNIKRRRQSLILWLEDYKSKHSCEYCGEKHVATLQFHHVNPKEKKLAISEMILQGFSKESILEEIKKCVLICANCHAIIHWEERNNLRDDLYGNIPVKQHIKRCKICGASENLVYARNYCKTHWLEHQKSVMGRRRLKIGSSNQL